MSTKRVPNVSVISLYVEEIDEYSDDERKIQDRLGHLVLNTYVKSGGGALIITRPPEETEDTHNVPRQCSAAIAYIKQAHSMMYDNRLRCLLQ